MKRNLLAITVLLSALQQAWAQPIIDLPSAPVAGSSFTFVVTDGIDLVGVGPDQVWDASGVQTLTGATLEFILAGAGTAGLSFPDAEVASREGLTETYLDVASDGLYILGSYVGSFPFTSVYTDPYKYLQFPSEMGDEWTDTYTGSYTYNGTTYPQNGSGVFIASGFGSLVLPWGTVANVLRIDGTELYSESGNGSVYEYEATVSYYYKPGVGYFVAKSTNATSSLNGTQNGETSTFGYLNANSVGLQEESQKNIGVEVFPNPADQVANIIYAANGARSMQVFNGEGRLVVDNVLTGSSPGVHKVSLDVNGWSSGVYTAVVVGHDGTQGVARFIVQP